MPNHNWSKDDDIVALYIYRFTDKDLPLSTNEIGEKLGMGKVSLRDRIKNFKFLHRGKGLAHVGKRGKEVYSEHKDTPQEELKSLVLRYLNT